MGRHAIWFGVAFLFLAVPASVTATMKPRTDAFNRLVTDGNVAAQAGHFDTAIEKWQRAIPIDPDPARSCRGASLRTSVRVARDTLMMLRQRKLTADKAAQWFQSHQTELWLPNPCNTN